MDLHLREFVDRFIFYWGVWEPDESWLLTRILRPGDNFVDVGANVGYFSLLGAMLTGHHGKVFAFEPCPRIFDRMNNNITLNTFDNIQSFRLACFNTSTTVNIFSGPVANPGASTMRSVPGCSEPVCTAAVRLDDVLPHDLRYRIIKIDVEGAELHVIEGMENLLNGRRIDAVLCEVTKSFLHEMGKSTTELFGRLGAAGFQGFRVGNRCLERIEAQSFTDGQANVLFLSDRVALDL